MTWLIIKNECNNDYVSPGLLAIEMTGEFRTLLGNISNMFLSHRLVDRVKYLGYDIGDFEPMYLADNTGDMGDFLVNDIPKDWIIVDDLPSGLPLLEDAVVNAMQVDCDGGVAFIGYTDDCDGDEIYTLAIQIDDLLAKEAVVVNWDEYLKGGENEYLPGYEWAIEHGYTLTASTEKYALYSKGGIFLQVYGGEKLEAELSARVGLVELSVPRFSFPGNIEMFERQIEKVYAPFREEWW